MYRVLMGGDCRIVDSVCDPLGLRRRFEFFSEFIVDHPGKPALFSLGKMHLVRAELAGNAITSSFFGFGHLRFSCSLPDRSRMIGPPNAAATP